MRPILLLKTGDLAPRVTQAFGPYERAFLDLLGDDRLVVADARSEAIPDGDWAGILITGSPAAVYDGDAWIARAEELLREAAERNIPLLGVCFGHQLLAQTFGGKVERCGRGWELGTERVTLTAAGRNDPLFRDLPENLDVQMSHGDVVVELPPGAVALAENEHSRMQAFRLGERIWGVQFHPEFSPALVTLLIELFFERPRPAAFPRRSADWETLREDLLANVRETPASQQCLHRFLALSRRD